VLDERLSYSRFDRKPGETKFVAVVALVAVVAVVAIVADVLMMYMD
jgi:hypothetical protein